MDKEYFIAQYDHYEDDYLLALRARGDELVEQAHEAIEELLVARGCKLPPRPTRPLDLQEARDSSVARRRLSVRKWIFIIPVLVVAGTIAQLYKRPGIVTLAVFAIVAFWVARRIWIARLPESRRRAVLDQEKRDQAIENGATQLMLACAEGDTQRVRELLSFGIDANQQDHRGGTALMYAAKNGHEEAVSLLLSAGASSHLATDRGNTAADFAIKGGFAQLANRLQAAASSQN